MGLSYQNPLLEFLYPDGWELNETRDADGLAVNLQSPFSAFAFVTVYSQPREPRELADQALRAMAEEYDELDSEPIEEMIAQVPAVGHDVNFFSLDLTNTCWIRALTCGGSSILIFFQTSDLDLERGLMAFRAICATLKFGAESAG